MRFVQKRREDKLYKQWVKHDGLPSEAIPQKEVSGDMGVRGKKNVLHPYILYILIGVFIVILCVGLVLLFV